MQFSHTTIIQRLLLGFLICFGLQTGPCFAASAAADPSYKAARIMAGTKSLLAVRLFSHARKGVSVEARLEARDQQQTILVDYMLLQWIFTGKASQEVKSLFAHAFHSKTLLELTETHLAALSVPELVQKIQEKTGGTVFACSAFETVYLLSPTLVFFFPNLYGIDNDTYEKRVEPALKEFNGMGFFKKAMLSDNALIAELSPYFTSTLMKKGCKIGNDNVWVCKEVDEYAVDPDSFRMLIDTLSYVFSNAEHFKKRKECRFTKGAFAALVPTINGLSNNNEAMSTFLTDQMTGGSRKAIPRLESLKQEGDGVSSTPEKIRRYRRHGGGVDLFEEKRTSHTHKYPSIQALRTAYQASDLGSAKRGIPKVICEKLEFETQWTLDLSGCGLKNLEGLGDIENIEKVNFLDLSSNELELITQEDISCCPDLRIINISQNPISDLPENLFSEDQKIQVFICSGTNITSFTDKIFNFADWVEHLNLSGNPKLTSLDMERLVGIRTVVCSHNRALKSLPVAHWKAYSKGSRVDLAEEGLKTVDVSYCGLSKETIDELIPYAINYLSSLSIAFCPNLTKEQADALIDASHIAQKELRSACSVYDQKQAMIAQAKALAKEGDETLCDGASGAAAGTGSVADESDDDSSDDDSSDDDSSDDEEGISLAVRKFTAFTVDLDHNPKGK